MLVAVLSGGLGRRRWTWTPAAELAVLAVLIALKATALLSAFDYLWPLALIAGGFILWQALGRPYAAEPVENGKRTPATGEERGSR